MGKKLVFESAIITTLLTVLMLSAITLPAKAATVREPGHDGDCETAYRVPNDSMKAWVTSGVDGYYPIGLTFSYNYAGWYSYRFPGTPGGDQPTGNLVFTWSYWKIVGGMGWVDMSGSISGDGINDYGYLNYYDWNLALKCYTQSWFIANGNPVLYGITATVP